MATVAHFRRREPSFLSREVTRTCDLDEARAVGGDLFFPHDLRVVGGGSFRLDIQAARFGAITLGWVSYGTEIRVRTGVLGSGYEVNVPICGAVRTASGSERVMATPRRAAVYRADRDSQFEGWAAPCQMLAIKIERRALENELSALLGRSIKGPLKLRTGLDIETGRGRQWWSLVRALAEQVRDPDSLARHPLIGAPLTQSIVAGLLLATDHEYRTELDAIASPVRMPMVRRAVDYIELHASEAITVNDIASATGIGIRALQHGFQVELGTTPLTHLRAVRLARARAEFLRADPREVGVAEVAYRWGFSHLGRFASDYRDHFNETPSQTLHRPR